MPDQEHIGWHCHTKLEKFRPGETEPYEVIEEDGNLLTYGGASAIWDLLIDGGSITDPYDNTNAFIGVGTGTTAVAATQETLAALSPNTHYEAMDATYPQHTDGTSLTAHAQVIFKSTFESADAQFAWNEWGIFNAAGDGIGRMLNRKLINYGVKGATEWSLTITLTIS